MKLFFFLFFQFLCLQLISQVEDSLLLKYQDVEEVYADKEFYSKYKVYLRRVRKVYPLALYAAEKLKEIDVEVAESKSKHKKKKVAKKEHKALKDDFYYVIRDMYTLEGEMLMKLIYRETGLTVREIIKKYRGSFNAGLNDNLGKLWEQDLDLKYDPKGEDWIIEKVINDIKNNKVAFEKEAKILTKEEFKSSQKQYKINKKAAKKAMRSRKKEAK